jgi:hypothetical protein
MLPITLFTLIYWLCGANLDLAIFVGHVLPPLISCYLLYRIAYLLSGNKNLAVFAVLIAVGHFLFSLLAIAAKLFGLSAGGIAGPDFYLLKQIFVHAGMFGNITAPTQFGRLFSPALTLPFLLLAIPLILAGSRPALRGLLISLNLYVYPHHVIVLTVLEMVAWLRNRKLPNVHFFIIGALVAIPYLLQLWMVHSAGTYQDIYGRIGQTSELSSLWFFTPFFAVTSLYLWHKDKLFTSALVLSLGCFTSVVIIWLLDHFFKFPQVHLVGIRIFVFLAPLTLISILKHFNLPKLKYVNVGLLTLILFGYIHSGWVHRNEYSQFPSQGIVSELAMLPAGMVVMTDVQKEIPYIAAMTNHYSYLSYGIVSSASNQELIKRFVIVSRIYGWDKTKLNGGDWDGLMSTHHWIFHHGSNSTEAQNALIDQEATILSQLSPCELLRIYQVNYIRLRDQVPSDLEGCTTAISPHILKVVH